MKRTLLASTTLPLCFAATAPAWAQETAGQAPVESQVGLQEIVVTAQRRSESAQKAAIAIDVATPEELLRVGAVTPSGLNAVAPSLFVARSGGATTSFFVRGVGNFTNNAYSDPAVAFNFDGVYLGRPTSTAGTFYDLARVEVLKGPQGTLYGRNATGGAINVIPQRPVIGELSGYAWASYGNYNALDMEGALNVPIGQNGAFRLSGKVVDQDGFNQDGTSDEKSQALRAQVLAELTERLTLRVGADYSHTGGKGPGPSYEGTLAFTPGTAPTAVSPANYTFLPAPAGLGPRTGFHTPAADAYHATFIIGGAFINPQSLDRPFQDNTQWGVSAELNAEIGGAKLTVIPAYRETELDNVFNGGIAFRGGIIREKDRQSSIEARLTGKAGPIDWLVGGYHFNEDIDGQAGFNQFVVASLQNFKTGTTSNALFGRLTANLSSKFRLVGAARYTHDDKYFTGGANNLVAICTNAPPPFGPGCFGDPSQPSGTSLAEVASRIPAALLPFGFPTAPGPANARPFGSNGSILFYIPVPVNKKINASRVTYRLAAEYDLAPGSLLYASYETGFRSGGFSVSLGNEVYDPEFITAFTVGSKNRFFDNRLQVNIEAFYWRYRNQQVSHFGFDLTGGNSYFTENVGRSTIKGFDIDIEFKASPTTLLSGSIQYLDNRLNNFTYNTPRGATFLPPAVGCPFAPGTEPDGAGGTRPVYTVNCSGFAGYNSPRWALNGGLEQLFRIGGYTLVFNGAARYRSNRITGFEYLAQMNSGSDVLVDASLSLRPESEKWSVTAWVRNLTDRTVPGATQFGATNGNVIGTVYQPPRTYGIRTGFKF